jgi:hypothetical protein
MGRSVSYHRYAVCKVYLQDPAGLHADDVDDWLAQEYWRDFIADLQSLIKSRYPSMSECDRWADREEHIILENSRGEVSVSEYCGLVCICLAPRDPDNPLDQGWCDRSATAFERFLENHYRHCALLSRGHASNGEQFFAPLQRPDDGLVTSKEGVLW